MKFYSNPKFNECIKDELVVNKFATEPNTLGRLEFVDSLLGMFMAAAVFLASWLILICLEG